MLLVLFQLRTSTTATGTTATGEMRTSTKATGTTATGAVDWRWRAVVNSCCSGVREVALLVLRLTSHLNSNEHVEYGLYCVSYYIIYIYIYILELRMATAARLLRWLFVAVLQCLFHVLENSPLDI